MDMFLKVKITLTQAQVTPFIKDVATFLGTDFMKKRKWSLYGAFEVTNMGFAIASDGFTKVSASTDEQTLVRFLNIWQIPSGFAAGDVANIMLDLADNGAYVELDSHVQIEVQDIVTRINDPTIQPDAKMKREGVFACVRHYVDRKNLAEYALTAGALVPQWSAAQPNWAFLGSYQNVTGLLNVFWDIWHVTPDMTLPQFEKELATLASAKDLLSESYRHSISAEGGPPPTLPADFHDGLEMLKAAPYWSLA